MSHMEFRVMFSALFIDFSVVDSAAWLFKGNLRENDLFMLTFLKVSFVDPLLSCYALMTYLIILSEYFSIC